MTKGRQKKQWFIAILLALLVHLVFFVLLVFYLWPDNKVVVVSLTPLPGEAVDIRSHQMLQPSLRFSHALNDAELSGVKLYRIDKAGQRQEVSTAQRDPERDRVLIFPGITEEGTYLFYASDVDGAFLNAPLFLDGEFTGSFPSGDGKAGGAFEAQFEVKRKETEVMTARVYDAKKPEVNEEQETSMPAAQLQPKAEKRPIQEPKKTKLPAATKKTQADAPMLPSSAVLPPTPEIVQQESPKSASLQDLRVSSLNLASSLTMQSAELADAVFAQRDTNPYAEAAKLEKKRFESAYGGNGPAIRPGQEGNALTHIKEVAEYIALMHQEIHPQWGAGYLMRLDTIYRSRDARINDSDLEVKVEIVMDPYGRVQDVHMIRSTGITTFDSEAIAVAWRSSPGFETPIEMRSKNGKSYIHWTFWRDSRQCGVFGVKVFKLEGLSRSNIDFNLKAVQDIEKRLGLKPSVLEPRGQQNEASEPLPERVDPMDD